MSSHHFEPNYIHVFDHDNEMDLPFGTAERNMMFLIGHEAFFLSNFFNIIWLVVIEWYVLRSLPKNRLHQIVLVGCILQLLSCVTSLIRHNMNDEHGYWGILGSVTGNAAFCALNAAVSAVFLFGMDSKTRARTWKIVAGIIALVTTVSSIVTWIWWDQINFSVFRATPPLSALYQTIAMIYCLNIIQKQDSLALNPSILPKPTMVRLLGVLIGINVLGLGLMFTRMPLWTYPNTGWFYMVCVVFTKYAGQMDFVRPAKEQEEDVSLLPRYDRIMVQA